MNPPRWATGNTEVVRGELTRRVVEAKEQLDSCLLRLRSGPRGAVVGTWRYADRDVSFGHTDQVLERRPAAPTALAVLLVVGGLLGSLASAP